MGNLPTLKPRDVVALLLGLGFAEVRQRGSHKQFRHLDGRGTTYNLRDFVGAEKFGISVLEPGPFLSGVGVLR